MFTTYGRRAALPLAALAAVAALAAAQPSQATIMQAVFTGTIDQDVGGTGADMFGLTQAQVVGSVFTMTLRYDTSLGVFGTFSDEAGLFGSDFDSIPIPITAAKVEINGVTRALPSLTSGEISMNNDSLGRPPAWCASGDGPAVLNLDHQGQTSVLSSCVQKTGFPLSEDFSTPFELHSAETFHVRSQMILFQTAADGFTATDELEFLGNAHDLVVTRLPDQGPGGVPEPAAWALMIAGFGLAGARLRARRALAG